MEIKFILAQIPAIIGTTLYFLSFQCRSNRKLYTVQIFSYLAYTVHFIILGAMTGGLSYILNLARSLCLASKWKFARSKKMCAFLCSMQLVVLVTTWAGWISLLPVLANIATTVGGYTHNAQKIRIAGIFINPPLWIVYDIIVGSWAGIIDEVISILSGLISIKRFGWKNLNQTGE